MIQVSLNLVLNGLINNMSARFSIMACFTDDVLLKASLLLDELTQTTEIYGLFEKWKFRMTLCDCHLLLYNMMRDND